MRKDGGRMCRECKRIRGEARRRANGVKPPLPPLGEREFCNAGHKITPDSLLKRKGRGDECRECRNEYNRKRSLARRKDPLTRDEVLEYDRLRKRKLRAEGNDVGHRNDEKRSAPHNALGIKPKAEVAWEAMGKMLDRTRTPCHNQPDLFIDYADPRNEPEAGDRPMPTTRQAEAMCHGCPILNECLSFALAQKEDFGVWGGKRIVGGRVYRGTRVVPGA